MNYRHAFHAGGFADVIKHIVLVRILSYLQDKPAAFRVIDTHAGAGLYDLTSDEARRGGDWLTGIARLLQARFSENVALLVKPYLDIVRAFNPQRDLQAYPGSPLIARALLRPQDRLTACEVESKARKRLIDALRRDTQARVVDLDGWMALPAFVPPKERRGLVLIDPPFEAQEEEFRTIEGALLQALERWPTGTYAIWYPIKLRHQPQRFQRWFGLQRIPKVLCTELLLHPDNSTLRLNGCGMVIVNPPWKFDRQLEELLPSLRENLAQGRFGETRVEWLTGEP
jgi:23S rRNA (adenine2030-N6)-methyltransferase